MSEIITNIDAEKVTSEIIIEKFIKKSTKSANVQRTMASALRYFTDPTHFGYGKHLFDLKERDIMKYKKWLNSNQDIALSSKELYWRNAKKLFNYLYRKYKSVYGFQALVEAYFLFNDKTWQRWNDEKYHKEAISNKHVRCSTEELTKILHLFKTYNYSHYRIYRTMIETGMRKGETVGINITRTFQGKIIPISEDLKKRFVVGYGKKGQKAYYMTLELADILLELYNQRVKVKTESQAFFLTKSSKTYHETGIAFSQILRKTLRMLGITKSISPHTFRRTLNTLRKKMGCNKEDRHILLNHKEKDVNLENYVLFNTEEYAELYDKWNPYKYLNF